MCHSVLIILTRIKIKREVVDETHFAIVSMSRRQLWRVYYVYYGVYGALLYNLFKKCVKIDITIKLTQIKNK